MTSDCAVPVEPTLHPALANRFSPTEFDPRATMSDAEVDVLLEAARRAPSAGNSQPWSFIIQGLAMGLASHQFRAFDRDGLTREFDVPAHWEVTTMTAFGLAVGPATEAPGSTRARASRAEITWPRG